ncbi:uncharacterized protein LOC115733134 [Rhodamnia argentea]|uniref:Uncharacterized protein LOC115733134 n=1 Tax=Rhodamnia argentea TaxID=178133 RepID=A0A8B8MZ99_9MYRT|nr:uncharacterized protein LOC115733134 [Rhodamnia argentea]
MALTFLRRGVAVTSGVNSRFLPRLVSIWSSASEVPDKGIEKGWSELVDNGPKTTALCSNRIQLSPLFADSSPSLDGCAIELVDDDQWRVSAGLAQAWQGSRRSLGTENFADTTYECEDHSSSVEEESDSNEIDNMRIRGNLFYKIDKASKEFEEYNLEFHRKKSPKRREDPKESKKKVDRGVVTRDEKLPKAAKKKNVPSLLDEAEVDCATNGKRLRTPTFNQLTGPYHEPFCLDIYISKASVRACIIHRATSKVVAVAHSISKDMKFDLTSTRNAAACAAVGEILAQRALADDIHDIIYMPRKGEKMEGKLMIVLQAVIDNGVKVKVKLKQRKLKKANHQATI